MKKLNKHKILSAACIAALPLLVVACLEFDGIIQPGRALTDSEIEVTAQLRVSPGEDGSGKVVFAVLAPKAWNLRDNATLYLTTKDYNAIQHQPEVVNEQLTLMPAEEKDPKNGLSWAELLHERHRPRRQRPPNGNGVGRMAFVDHLHIRRQDRSGRTGGRDGRRACRRQDQDRRPAPFP